jgi:DsbC/DsbD-like thiol-disulfide interchange protein
MKMNYQARFSGRQNATTLSPARAGWGFLSSALHLKLICLSAICVILVLFSSCNKSRVNESQPTNTPQAAPNVKSSADVVKVQAAPVSIPAGGNTDATVLLSISPGFHVNANPATFSYLIPTEITPGKIDGIAVGKAAYPAAEKKKFQFADQPLAVYEGETPIKLNLRVEKNAATGLRSLPITVRVQACDTEQCFPPDTLHATIAVEVK